MKRVLVLILTCFGAAQMFGAETLDAITWHGVQTYDVAALKKIEKLQVGKFVGVRYQFRSKRIRHLKPGWYEASLWQHNPRDARKPFSYVRAMIARKDLPAFEALPSDFKSGMPLTVYGQVQKDPAANFIFVRLIGNRVTHHLDRSATVGW